MALARAQPRGRFPCSGDLNARVIRIEPIALERETTVSFSPQASLRHNVI